MLLEWNIEFWPRAKHCRDPVGHSVPINVIDDVVVLFVIIVIGSVLPFPKL